MVPRPHIPARAHAVLPPWLSHALRTQRGPVPWSAVTRGVLSAGPGSPRPDPGTTDGGRRGSGLGQAQGTGTNTASSSQAKIAEGSSESIRSMIPP